MALTSDLRGSVTPGQRERDPEATRMNTYPTRVLEEEHGGLGCLHQRPTRAGGSGTQFQAEVLGTRRGLRVRAGGVT